MKKEVKIGIFAVAMILCAWGGIRFLSGIDIFSRNVDYYAAYDQVSGIQGASPVMIRGVKVGTVSEILFDPARDERVVLRLTLKKQYGIPADSEAKIVSSGLMGGKEVEILLGTSPERLAKGDTIRSRNDRDMMEMAVSELDFLKERIVKLTDELSATLTGVSGVVGDNAANIKGLTTHLNAISANLDQILGSEKEGLRSAVQGLETFSQALGDNASRLDTLMGNAALFSERLAESNLIGNLDRSLAGLDALLSRIDAGEGSMGQLVTDAKLYDELARTSENLAELLADLKAHPQRYVHFSLFGRSEAKEAERLAKQERKAAEQRMKDSLKAIGK